VNKREGLYYITKRGIQEKEFYDGRNLKDVNSKCPRFIFIVHYLGKYYLKECLRPKSFYILPGGTPVKGETVQDSCRRILYDKYGLIGEVEYRCAHHYINYTSDRDVLFDNICLVFDVELKKSYRKQDSWFTMDQIKKLKQIHPTIHKFILEDAREPFSTLAFVHDYGFEKEDSK
jgi:ADP-ribose pyrophosphatase YjhB (NUDIX family)